MGFGAQGGYFRYEGLGSQGARVGDVGDCYLGFGLVVGAWWVRGDLTCFGAEFGEIKCNGSSDASRGAGDDGDFSFE